MALILLLMRLVGWFPYFYVKSITKEAALEESKTLQRSLSKKGLAGSRLSARPGSIAPTEEPEERKKVRTLPSCFLPHLYSSSEDRL